MRIWLISDTHFEVAASRREWQAHVRAPEVYDVLVHAGDLWAEEPERGIAWLADTAAGRPVVFAPGNWDHAGEYFDCVSRLGVAAEAHPNVHLLSRNAGSGVAEVGGVRFVGGTLWTDLALNGAAEELPGEAVPLVGPMVSVGERSMDASWVRGVHRRDLRLIRYEVAREDAPGPVVVVTHYAPSERSLDRGLAGKPMAALSASALDGLLDGLEGARVPLWLHGHVHRRSDYVARGGTRVVCRPFGFGGDVHAFRDAPLLEL